MAGVYAWIREGVRRAVLLGFSDAVQQLGIPEQDEEVHPKMAALLSDAPGARGNARITQNSNRRKRLGKSLGEIATTNTPAANS